MRLFMLELENTHPPPCSPDMYCRIVAGSWQINGVGNSLEDLAGKSNVNGALNHVSKFSNGKRCAITYTLIGCAASLLCAIKESALDD